MVVRIGRVRVRVVVVVVLMETARSVIVPLVIGLMGVVVVILVPVIHFTVRRDAFSLRRRRRLGAPRTTASLCTRAYPAACEQEDRGERGKAEGTKRPGRPMHRRKRSTKRPCGKKGGVRSSSFSCCDQGSKV